MLHNTVLNGRGATGFFNSIDYRFAESDVLIANNLTQRISQRDQASGTTSNNLEQTSLDFFVDALAGDFHLKPSAAGAIDQGRVETEAGIDLDGQTHDVGAPDLGADEYRP